MTGFRLLVATIAVGITAGTLMEVHAGGGREEPEAITRTPAPTQVSDQNITAPRPAPDELPREFLDQNPPPGAHRSFQTDFSRATVDYGEIVSGGPPKDGIPSIDAPQFVSIENAREWLTPREAVLVVSRASETRIYPLQILMWHEIVNDTVAGLPVAVTWCPLCNTAVAFDRRAPAGSGSDEHAGNVFDFGVTGRLRYSNLIMYDRTTESWWQQADGEGIAGVYAGARLGMVPVLTLSFEEARRNYPDARVLSRDTGHRRAYGRNPYQNYEESPEPFLYRGPETDPTYRSLERVLVYIDGAESHALAYSVLRKERVVPIVVQDERAYALWAPGVAGTLSAETVDGGPDTGTANAFLAQTGDGTPVELYRDGDTIRDRETESSWSAGGRATDGPREGAQLLPVPTVQHFWFSAAAFGASVMEESPF